MSIVTGTSLQHPCIGALGQRLGALLGDAKRRGAGIGDFRAGVRRDPRQLGRGTVLLGRSSSQESLDRIAGVLEKGYHVLYLHRHAEIGDGLVGNDDVSLTAPLFLSELSYAIWVVRANFPANLQSEDGPELS